MLDLRPVGFIIGLLVVALGAAMLLPASVDLLLGNGNGPAILQAAMLTMFTGGAVALSCANVPTRQLGIRQAFVLTAAIWFAMPAFGSLPLILGEPDLTFTDAMFEAVSGITTTGSTVIVGLDHLPAGTNLWRGMLNWLGGLGIAFIAMIFLPVMRVGGCSSSAPRGSTRWARCCRAPPTSPARCSASIPASPRSASPPTC